MAKTFEGSGGGGSSSDGNNNGDEVNLDDVARGRRRALKEMAGGSTSDSDSSSDSGNSTNDGDGSNTSGGSGGGGYAGPGDVGADDPPGVDDGGGGTSTDDPTDPDTPQGPTGPQTDDTVGTDTSDSPSDPSDSGSGGSGGGSGSGGGDPTDPDTPQGPPGSSDGAPGDSTLPDDFVPEDSSETAQPSSTTNDQTSTDPLSNVNVDSTYSENTVASEIESQTGLERGEDFTVTYDDGSYDVSYTDQYQDRQREQQKQQVVEQVDEQYDRYHLTQEDVSVKQTTNESGETVLTASLTDEAAEMVSERQAANRLDVPVTAVEVTQEGGEASLSLTEEGQQIVSERKQDRRAAAAAATSGSGEMARSTNATDFETFSDEVAQAQQTVEAQTGLTAGEDFRIAINERGQVTAERTQQESRLNEQTQAEFQRGNYGDPREIVADQVSDQVGFNVTEADVKEVNASDSGIQYSLQPQAATAVAFKQQANAGPGSVDIQRTNDGGFDVSVSGSANASEIENDLDRSLDQRVEAASPEQSTRPQEVADADWSVGLGNPNKDEVENAIDNAAGAYSNAARGASEAIFGKGAPAGQSAGEELLKAAGYPQAGRTYEQGLRTFGKSTFQGAAAIGNLPGIVGGLMEGGEAAGYAAAKTAQGESDKVGREAGKLYTSVKNQVIQNPVQTGGLLVGSLAGSTGVFRATRKLGPRANKAARYAIQPGEEIAGRAGAGITRRVAGDGTAQKYFPNNEPLVFSEEAAIRGAKGVARRARATKNTLASRTSSGTLELQGSPRQRELIQRFRPRSSTSELGEEGVPGAQSEPLGSNTEDILDATVGTPRQPQTEATTDTNTQNRVEATGETGDDTSQISAQMQAAASDATARDQLASALDEFGVRVDEFAADTRGQADLTFGRSRGQSDTTTDTRSIDDDRVTANLYQQAVEQQVRADYDVLEGGSGTRSGESFAERASAQETTVEAERPGGESARREAERNRVRTDSGQNEARARVEAMLTQQSQGSPVETRQGLINAQMQLLGAEGSLDATGLAAGLQTESESRLGFDSETDTQTQAQTEGEFGGDRRQRRDRDRRRNELEATGELNLESGSRIEGDRGDNKEPPASSSRRSRAGRSGSAGRDSSISAGWVNEFVTDVALGPGANRAPSQRSLESSDGEQAFLAEQRPTQVMLSGTSEQQAQIENAQDFLFFTDDNGAESGDGGSNTDSESGWGDLL